jgi:nascent polypeptide-associated complex subunit alpha
MQQMMKQMGIDVDELDAEEVVIRTADEEYVFDAPQVTKMDAQGQETFQIVGDYDVRAAGAGGDATPVESADTADDGGIPDSDVQIVAQRAGVSEDAAREALADEDGDLAAAISRLE